MAIFRGATAVRSAIANYLEGTVPDVIDRARSDWSLDEYQLPYPVKYDAYEPYALDRWPLIGINVVQAGQFTRREYVGPMSQRYMSNYTARVFTWVRTPYDESENPIEPEYSESLRLRDDLAACVRAAILMTGSFGQPAIVFDETSLSEEYSEATGVKGDKFVSGTVHSFEFRFDETVPLVGLGEADTITVIGHKNVGPSKPL